MSQAQFETEEPGQTREIYEMLLSCSQGQRNDHFIASMLASNSVGDGEMPEQLGLDDIQYSAMLKMYYPDADNPVTQNNSTSDQSFDRSDEKNELLTLLLKSRADDMPDTNWIAEIVVAGCMGGNHLWQDLGLWCRQDLTSMMETNFPELAQRNDKNMKWKKFLYKQLCIQEGIYTCRSPSCEVCADYKECFAPE